MTLRAPAPAASPADAARGFRVAATEASREADGSIVLRAPPARNGGDKVVLRPPAARAPTEKPAPRPAPPRPARTLGGLVLRPALDQRDQAPPRSAGAAREVQLGAWRSQAEADAGWDKAKAQAQAPGLLGRLSFRVVMADLPGKGRYYRLRVSPAPGQSQASLCDSLVAQGLACLPVRD